MRIKVIKPKKKPVDKRLRVCAYVRVSATSDELAESLEAQKQHYQDFITSNPAWEFAGIYADDGISGFFDKRPQFQAMMKDARKGLIDLVVVKSVSRFARNTETLLKATRELRSLGIDVYFELQQTNTLTASGELLLTIKAAFAQAESDSGSQLIKMSCRHRFEKGIPMARTLQTYGYQPGRNGRIVVDEEQAVIVQSIFDMAEQGVWVTRISAKLNKLGIPSPEDKQWYEKQISKMLRNVTYKGDLHLQKTFKDANHKTRINRGEVPSWYVHGNHEPIISTEQWERVQQMLAYRAAEIAAAKEKRNAPKPAHRATNSGYPLSGLLYCPYCGALLHHKWCNGGKDEYWVCSTNIKQGASSCKGLFLPAKATEGWDIHEPVIVERYEDANGMTKFTAYPREEFEQTKGD